MTKEEFRKLVQDKLKEADISNYTKNMAVIICDVYEQGFTDGFEIATKIKQL